jgi:Histidine kinase-, DNA gyrase B-, and HSP90-like ATPase
VDYDIVPPDPAGMIESLSALGYTLESAVADLVDNSIDAGAKHVDVIFHWAGLDSYVAVVDDGRGMTEGALMDAMAIALRGPRAAREVNDLGRFGMGLKTASFSQARMLAVCSKSTSAEPATRVWDLDHVLRCGDWQLLHEPDDQDTAKILDALAEDISGSGTVVLWRRLTKMVDEFGAIDDEDAHGHFLEAIARVDRHLGMTFERFLGTRGARARKRSMMLTINSAPVSAWDPFMTWHEATLPRPIEKLEVDGHRVVVRPYVLPPKRRLTDEEYRSGAGPRGWLEQQGFYVYRNDRLIVPGEWLELPGFRKDEKHVMARIAVEVPAALDHLWSVDVKKASARPPLPLRGSLSRSAKATRVEAQGILSAISRTTGLLKSDDLSFVWRPERTDGNLRLRINWQHPLVKEALQTSSDARPVVRALLRFLEETVPLSAIRMMFDDSEDRDYQPFSGSPPDEVMTVAERLYSAYVSQGLTPAQAAKRLQHTAPFNEYPDLLHLLNLT